MKRSNRFLTLLMRYGLPLFVSVGLCYLLLGRVDLRENIEIVSRYCNFWWIGGALLLSAFSNVIRALRWRIQLRALGISVPLKNLVYSFFGTYAVNLVLPRLGEVWRTGYISRLEGVSFTKVFGSMLSDRLADALSVLCIFLLTLALASGRLMDFIASEPGRLDGVKAMAASPWLWTAVGVVVIGAWLLLTRKPAGRVAAKVQEMWRSLWQGFVVILKMPGRGRWLWLTLALWGCYYVQLYVAFFAFGFTSHIATTYGPVAVLVCFVLSSIAMVLPSNGGYGPWQMAVIFGLSFYSGGAILPAGVTFETMSIGFANCVMTSQTLLLILLGLYTFAAIALERRRAAKKLTDKKEPSAPSRVL